jgi:uncharacterized protein (TIGR02594 family)
MATVYKKENRMSRVAIIFAMILTTACSREVYSDSGISLTYARSLVGLHEERDNRKLREIIEVNPARTQWCAAFVNSILNLQGIEGSESVSKYPLTARSFLDWGEPVDVPEYGDIVVFPRGNVSWQGHVGFYVGLKEINDIDYYIILGGNQNNSVSYELYPAYRAIGIRRAIY